MILKMKQKTYLLEIGPHTFKVSYIFYVLTFISEFPQNPLIYSNKSAISIFVSVKPRIRVDKRDVRGGPNGFVTLECYIESFPPAKVVWKMQNGTIVQVDENIEKDWSR